MDKSVGLKGYTTYKIGGPASYFVEAKEKEDIVRALTEWSNIGGSMKDVFVLGGGANVLF